MLPSPWGFLQGSVPAAPREDRDGHGKQTLPQLSPIPYSSSHSYSVFRYLFIIKEQLGMTDSKIFGRVYTFPGNT